MLQEVKVRDAKSKEAEVVGILRPGSYVKVEEIRHKAARVEYMTTGLNLQGWIVLSKNSQPVLREDPFDIRPATSWALQRVRVQQNVMQGGGAEASLPGCLPQNSAEPLRPAFPESPPTDVQAQLRTGSSSQQQSVNAPVGDYRDLPAAAWRKPPLPRRRVVKLLCGRSSQSACCGMA